MANEDKNDPKDSAEVEDTKVDDAAAEKPEKAASKKAATRKPAAKKAAEPLPVPAPAGSKKVPSDKAVRNVAFPIVIVIAVACLVGGALLGHFALGSLFGSSVSGKTSLAEGELDSTVATYTYDGKSYTVSARDVITASSSLDSAKQDDDTYTMPSADDILSKARNEILAKEVEAKGITVSDDDVSTYANDTLGSDDYATIATQYSMDEDGVKAVLKQSCGVKKLYDQVVTTTTTTAPTAPTSPSDDNNDTMTAEYGAYIVNLLGDEWDSTNNTWARTDGPFYSSMSSMTFTSDSASYTQAETAYYVAYQQYSQTASSASTEWTDYVNGLLSKASISIDTLVA